MATFSTAASLRLRNMSDAAVMKALKKYGSINKTAAALEVGRRTLQLRVKSIQEEFKQTEPEKPVPMRRPKQGVRRWIFSSAQCDTAIHAPFLTNLKAYAEHVGATIHIAGFTYNVGNYTAFNGRYEKERVANYHPEIVPYLTNKPFEAADKLLFCGEQNTNPTAEDPLSGFEAYTRDKWGIFPHPKVVLRSVPVRMTDEPKIIMTTGAVTRPNYIQKKAGIKATFHHVIGAVIVEMDSDGDFFCRHIQACEDGSFCDLDAYVVDGYVHTGENIVALVAGDVHVEGLDHDTAFGTWGIRQYSSATSRRWAATHTGQSLVEVLQPRVQYLHDILDWRRRNHHVSKDPHHLYKMHVEGTECVREEVKECASFVYATEAHGRDTYVVDSNHDRAFDRWLKTIDFRSDPVNAAFYLDAQQAYYQAIRDGEDKFIPTEWALRRELELSTTTFLHETDTSTVFDIEMAMHGDKANAGRPGSIKAFAKMGPKACIAHTHGAGIFEGIYQAGHACRRDQGYNRGGLTHWNPSHIIVYENGKRAIITMRGEKWRAE